jgi:predicted DNA-binding transcriptional regulator YafY
VHARGVTGPVLADVLGVSLRTIERDLAELRAAGVPVITRRGTNGCYAMDTRRELPPLALTPGEAAAIVAALVAIGPQASATAQSALDKLLTAMAPAGAATDPTRRK